MKKTELTGKNPLYIVHNKSQQDYLRAIYLLSRKNRGPVRSVELAEFIGFSRSSVCRAVRLLMEDGYLLMDEGFYLHLTEYGRSVAEKIHEKHCFFKQILIEAGVDPGKAEYEANEIIHSISEESFEKLRMKGMNQRTASGIGSGKKPNVLARNVDAVL